ncbi:6045_t:CDS:2 [Cetraspora pellucida]|uniref:6045_t:CDS:1 n=1 Tax=Cetraspora pellucida TaxID=1433469 RepID=A0ACA9NL96_9GLOM|nr:6045_t:CDS:2 [Cetraspora pellucida]
MAERIFKRGEVYRPIRRKINVKSRAGYLLCIGYFHGGISREIRSEKEKKLFLIAFSSGEFNKAFITLDNGGKFGTLLNGSPINYHFQKSKSRGGYVQMPTVKEIFQQYPGVKIKLVGVKDLKDKLVNNRPMTLDDVKNVAILAGEYLISIPKRNDGRKLRSWIRLGCWNMIDNKLAYVVITCKRDNTWFYHKTVMASHGTATITRSQLTKYRLKRNADGTAEKNEKGGVIIDYENPFPDHCFSFCGDLRCEKVAGGVAEKGSVFGEGGKGNIKIMSPDGKTVLMTLPSNMSFKPYDNPAGIENKTAHPSFIGKNGEIEDPNQLSKHCSGYGTAFTAWLPNVFNEQPHLIYHSLVQFYFMRKLITSVELKRCKITYKGAETKGGNPTFGDGVFGSDIKKGEIHCIKYRIRIMSSAAGITYHFEKCLTTSWALATNRFLNSIKMRDDNLFGRTVQNATKKMFESGAKAIKERAKRFAKRAREKFMAELKSRITIGGVLVKGSGKSGSTSWLAIAALAGMILED